MADQHHIQPFTAADIERYHQNLMTMQERHALEKAALDDPMLADAIEGYALINDVSAQSDIEDLKSKIEGRIHRNDQENRGGFMLHQWFRIAAMLLLLAGAGAGIYFLSQQSTQNNIATTSPAEMQTKKEDTTASGNDTTQTITVTSPVPPEKNEVVIIEPNEPIVKTNHHVPLKTTNTIVNDTINMQAGAAAQQSALALKDETLKTEAFNQRQQAETRLMKASEMRASSNVFRGQVTDKNNQPLPFANVSNTSNDIGTYTDAKGYFTLVSADSALKVKVKSVGYENDTIQLNAVAGINKVTLSEDNSVVINRISVKKTAVAKRSNITFQEPEPEDGWAYYDLYIANNLQVPEEIKAKPSNGEVELSFEIDQNGEPANIKIEKSLCPACDQEAIRLIKQGPKWKKGKTKRVKIGVGY